jgi:2-phosphoglycolate phosphatase
MTDARALIVRARAIVFDLDGTLVDTMDDLWRALNNALQVHGHRAVPRAIVMASLHGGLNATARAALESQNAAPTGLEALEQTYLRQYRKRRHAGSRLYPGVLELLSCCSSRRRAMAVCTNKPTAEAVDLLSCLGARKFFGAVIGADACDAQKPDPAPLRLALNQLRATADDAVFIGDSIVDMECAERADVSFMLHTAGYGSDAALASCKADFSSYHELVAAIAARPAPIPLRW